jgi:hypothetical protein
LDTLIAWNSTLLRKPSKSEKSTPAKFCEFSTAN